MRPVILDTYRKLDSLDIACIGDVVCSVLFLQGPQTHNKKVPNEWDCAKAAAMEILPKVAYVIAFGNWMFIYFWVNPKLDQIKDSLENGTIGKVAMEDEIKRNHQRLCGLLDSKEGQFEARDSVGQGKETDGRQAS